MIKKIINRVYILIDRYKWRKFKKRYLLNGISFPDSLTEEEQKQSLSKEDRIQNIIKKHCKTSFLEIGIGGEPIISRINLFNDLNISYTGCDFKKICQDHTTTLTNHGINQKNIMYLSNETGTYSWNLFDLMQKGEKFDIIYIDGHHTFYIDLPAFILSDCLLKPGGLLLVDDIEWTLEFVKKVMGRFFWQWVLYKDTYNFKEYSMEQQNIPHIKMIAKKIMIEKFNYEKINEYSDDGWWALKKTHSI